MTSGNFPMLASKKTKDAFHRELRHLSFELDESQAEEIEAALERALSLTREHGESSRDREWVSKSRPGEARLNKAQRRTLGALVAYEDAHGSFPDVGAFAGIIGVAEAVAYRNLRVLEGLDIIRRKSIGSGSWHGARISKEWRDYVAGGGFEAKPDDKPKSKSLQDDLVDAISAYQSERGMGPTADELESICGTNRDAICYTLSALLRKGIIEGEKSRPHIVVREEGDWAIPEEHSALTDAQRAMIETIKEHQAAHGEAPSVADLAKIRGVERPAAYQMIKKLVDKGVLERGGNRASVYAVQDESEWTAPQDSSPLTDSQRQLLELARAQHDELGAMPSAALLAKISGRKYGTVYYGLKALKEKGYLESSAESRVLELTSEQDAYVEAIRAFQSEHGYAPQLGEIAEMLGKSKDAASSVLRALLKMNVVSKSIRLFIIHDEESRTFPQVADTLIATEYAMLETLKTYQAEHGVSPTLEELAEMRGQKRASVRRTLYSLKSKGVISGSFGAHRRYTLKSPPCE